MSMLLKGQYAKVQNSTSTGTEEYLLKVQNSTSNNTNNNTQITIGDRKRILARSFFIYFKISKKDYHDHIKKYGIDYVLSKLFVLYNESRKEEIKNPGGWLYRALSENWIEKKKEDIEAEERQIQLRKEQKALDIDEAFKGLRFKSGDSPEALKFFSLFDDLKNQETIDKTVERENTERKIELHKQIIKILTDAQKA